MRISLPALRLALLSFTALSLTALSLAGCESDPSVPFVPPDRGPAVRADRGPDLDQGPPADDGPAGDAWVDPDDGVPRDARVGADGGDMAPVVSPRPVDPQAVVVLRARPDAWVAWVADGALWAVRMDQQGGLGEPRRVTAVPDGFTGPLLGGRSGIQPAWVVLPNGANGQLQAYDLADAAAAPVPLNLWPPAQVAVTGTAQHIIGRSGPGAGDPLAWRTLAHPGAEPPPPEDVGAEDMGADAGEDTPADPADPRTLDVKGMADPIAASAGLADHVLAFQSGMCAAVLGEGRLGNAWPCGARPGAQLMGFDKQMVFVGQRGGQLATWDGTPAAADRTPVAVADLTDGITWLPPVGSVRFLIAGEPDGRYLWWFEFDRVKRSAQPVAADVLAASFSVLLPDQALLLAWSEDGTLRVDTVALQAVDRASALPPLDADCLASTVLPEDCDARDQDCDGAPRNGLCCQDRGAQPTRARLPERVEGPWFTGVGDGYMLLLTGDGQQAELRRLTPAVDGAEPAATVVWPGVTALQAMANDESRVVALAQGPAGAELLWYVGAQGLDTSVIPPRGPRTAAPCEAPLGLAMQGVGQGLVARVFCPDQAFDYTGPAAEPVARDYAAGPLRWLTALPPDGGPQAWLVATGDTHTLARWRWADDGFEPIEGLPLELEVLADGPGVNREWPIQAPVAPGGWPARVVDAQLQVLLPEGEWWRAPGTRWPVAARLSAYEPLAVTVGHLDGPASRLTLFLHHLGPDGAFWGRPGVDSGELRWALADDQGPAVGAFEAGPFKFPVTWIMRGAENGEVLGDVVSCD